MATNNNDRSADGELNQETTDSVEPRHPPDADPVIAAGLPGEGKRRSALTDEERKLLAWIESEDRHTGRQIDSGPIPPAESDGGQPAMRRPQATDTTYTVAVTFTVPAESFDYLLSPTAIQREFQMWLKSLGAAVHTVTVKPGDESS